LLDTLRRFQAAWPGTQASDDTLAEYLDALEPYGTEALRYAFERLRATHRSSFLPSIAEVREVCESFAAGRAPRRYCSYLAHPPHQHPFDGNRIPLYLGGYDYPVSCLECDPAAFHRERAAIIARHEREGRPTYAAPPEVAEALAAVKARMAMAAACAAAPAPDAVLLWCSECGDASSSRWQTPGQPHLIGEKLVGRRIVSACPGVWQTGKPPRRAA
jgi:hypothetical protein